MPSFVHTDRKVFYQRSQDGEQTIVLIHGATGNLYHWPQNLRRLPGYDVVAVDLPMHGRSHGPVAETVAENAEVIIALLDDLGVDKVILAGHSMGGAVSQAVALKHPEKVQGLILGSTGAHLPVNRIILDNTKTEESKSIVVKLIAKIAYGNTIDEEMVAGGIKMMEKIPVEVFYHDFNACNNFDVRDRLAEIEVPVLVLCGQEDKMTPPQNSTELSQGLPNSQIKLYPDKGHMLYLEAPDEVEADIKSWLVEHYGNGA